MSKRVQQTDAFAMVYGEFNDLEEEDRYIAFKARMMRELFPPGERKGAFDVEVVPLPAPPNSERGE